MEVAGEVAVRVKADLTELEKGLAEAHRKTQEFDRAASTAGSAQSKLSGAFAGTEAAIAKMASGVDAANAALARLEKAVLASSASTAKLDAAKQTSTKTTIQESRASEASTAAIRQEAVATDRLTESINRQNHAFIARARAREAAGLDALGRTRAEAAAHGAAVLDKLAQADPSTLAPWARAALAERNAASAVPIPVPVNSQADLSKAEAITRTASEGARATGMLASGLTAAILPASMLQFAIFSLAGATVEWATSMLKSTNTLETALKAHSDTLGLLKGQYGELGEAARNAGNIGGIAFTEASARNAQALLQAQLREQQEPLLKTLTGSDGWGRLIPGRNTGTDAIGRLENLSGDQKMFAAPVDALMKSVREGRSDLATFDDQIDNIFNKNLPEAANPALFLATAEAMKTLARSAFEVNGQFAAFAGPINKLKLEGIDGIATFNAEVEKIGQSNGLQELADKAIIAGKEFVDLGQKALELERIIRRLEAGKRGPLIGSSAEDERNRYLDDQRLAMRSAQLRFDADVLGMNARSPQERAAAARAREETRDVTGEDYAAKRQRVELAGLRALLDAERSLKDAQEQRLRSLDQAAASQELDLRLVGKTAGEAAQMRFEFERLAQIREQAVQHGIRSAEEFQRLFGREVELVKEAAAEAGKYADALARANVARDLAFEHDQLRRTTQDVAIASMQRSAGLPIDLNSPEAQAMRRNLDFEQAKDTAKSFLSTFQSTLVSSGGDVGKAMGSAILQALMNSMNRQFQVIFDQLAIQFASAVTGQSSGGASLTGAGASVAGSLFKSANDNYAPGAVTRAPLAPVGMDGYRSAIQAVESVGSGGYSALGPVIPKTGDRAYGAYQVMGANIPSWTKSALGSSMTPSQFLANPSAQDAVFDHQFGKYLSKYGNASDAASAWFTGGPLKTGANAKDVLGTSGSSYVDKFNAALNKSTGGLGKLGDVTGSLTKSTAQAGKSLDAFGGGLGKMGNALSQFPAAPSGGGGGLLGSLFGGLSSAFAGTSAFNWLSANPGGFINFYADGTESAAPGWAWVGEDGPELMRMRGGETIRSNPRSVQMAAEAGRTRQEVHVTVGVSVDDDGKIKAYVSDMGRQSAQAGAMIAVKQVKQSMPTMLAEAQTRAS